MLFWGNERLFNLPVWVFPWGLLIAWLASLAAIGFRSQHDEPTETSSLLGSLARSSTLICSISDSNIVKFRAQGQLLEQSLDECVVALPKLLDDIDRARKQESFMSFYTLAGRSYRVNFQPALANAQAITFVFVDVTQEQERNVELELTTEIFNNTSDAIIVADERRKIYSVNSEFSAITGFTADEVRGRKLGFPRNSENRFTFYREIINCLENQGYWHGDVWSKRKNGEVFSGRMKVTVHRGLDGKIKDYITFFSDITELRQSEEELRYLANHDTLTGLPNRRLFFDRVDQAVKRAKRAESQFAVYFIDLDSFKTINDELGHPVGDELLKMVSERLSNVVRRG